MPSMYDLKSQPSTELRRSSAVAHIALKSSCFCWVLVAIGVLFWGWIIGDQEVGIIQESAAKSGMKFGFAPCPLFL